MPSGSVQPRDEVQSVLYNDGLIQVDEYDIEPGVCVLPLAESPPTTDEELRNWSPVVVVRLHAPYRLRRSSSQTNKGNNPPVMPAPKDTGKFTFISGTLHFEKSLTSGLNSYDWLVSSNYVYVENCPHRLEDGFVLAVPSWTTQLQILNNQNNSATVPPVGAVAEAGFDARVGYNQGKNATTDGVQLKSGWGYNTAAFFPGVFFSSDMVNGGNQNLTVFISDFIGNVMGGRP